MASQPLEALLKIVTASQNAASARHAASSRSAEPSSSRPGDDRAAFGPVLNRALHSDKAPAAKPRQDASSGSAGSRDNREEPLTGAAESTPESEQVTDAERQAETQDAAEISADADEAAAALAAQSATIAAASDETAVVLDAEEGAATIVQEASDEQESGEKLPQDATAATTAEADAEFAQESGKATLATDAQEIGDVLPTPGQGAKEAAADASKDSAAAAAKDEAAESDVFASAERSGDATVEAPDVVPETPTSDTRVAAPSDQAETDDAVARVPDAESRDNASTDDGGDPDARPSGPQSKVDAPPTTTMDDLAATADGGSPVPSADAPVEPPSTPTPVAASGAAEASATRGAAAMARLSSGRAGSAADARSDADGRGSIERGRFLSRVEGAIRTAQQRDGRVQVRLSPPELGALRIELTVQNGVMTARLEAETSTARNILLDNLPALRDRLAQQDIRVERFDVDVRRDGGGSNQHEAQDRPTGDPSWRQGDQRRERAAAQQADVLRGPRASASRATTDAELDVRV